MNGETTETNNFVLDEDYDFYSLKKLGSTIENNFSYLMGVISNYVKKSYSYIVAASEDAQQRF